jgi:hypothetical protein
MAIITFCTANLTLNSVRDCPRASESLDDGKGHSIQSVYLGPRSAFSLKRLRFGNERGEERLKDLF